MSASQTTPLRGFRLSPYQRHAWQLQQASGGPCRWEVRVLLDGDLDHDRLHEAVRQVGRNHAILRTTFQRVPGMTMPLQVVSENDVELATSGPADEANDPLHLSLVEHGPGAHTLVLTASTLCADRTSLSMLVGEIAGAYGRRVSDHPGAEVMQYADFAAWHNEVLESATERDYAHWTAQRASEVTDAALLGATEAMNAGFESRTMRVTLPIGLDTGSGMRGNGDAPTLEAFLLGCWAAFLGRVTGRSEIVIGAPIGFHNHEELERTIGLLTAFAPLITYPSPGCRFTELVTAIAHSISERSSHQDYFVPRNRDTLPFCFEFVDEAARFESNGVVFSSLVSQAGVSDYTLKLVCVRRENALEAEMHYDGSRFAPARVEQVVARFERLLESVGREPDATIGRLEVLTETDRHRLLVAFNATDTPRTERCLHALFEEQAAAHPHATAVICGDMKHSFADLNDRANQIAHYLRELGVGQEAVVPVCMTRSFDMLAVLLGILKAGGAYAPLEPSDPPDRLRLLLRKLRAPVLLTQQSIAARFAESDIRVECLSGERADLRRRPTRNRATASGPKNLAYVIHTSGSTGQPKGVMIPHEGLMNYLSWCSREYAVPDGRGSIVHSGLAVDLTVTSLFAPLLAGQPVTLVPDDRGFGGLLSLLRSDERFSVVKTTPGQLQALNQMLTGNEIRARSGVLVVGGEQLFADDVALWRRHAPATRLINEYGPTETVVGCCFFEIRPGDELTGTVPIGRPIANARIYLLDDRFEPVPPGVTGELYVGGACVGRGYFDQPAATAQSFVPDPFSDEPGLRLYRTGDLARLRSDDNLEFVGRADQQVKIRGYRVEPAEVQATLARHPAVRQSAVVATDDGRGGKRLVAYVVADRQATSDAASDLRTFLAARLPDHMVPSAFVALDALPLNAGGKVDVRALPDSDSHAQQRPAHAPPRTLEEEVLAAIWSDVLKVECVGIDDNYFVLGGDSIRSLQVVARARKRGLNFSMDGLFGHPTIRTLARSLQMERSPDDATASASGAFSLVSPEDRLRMPLDVEDAYPLTMLQGGMLFHRAASPDSSVYHDIFSLHLKAALDVEVLETVIGQLIRRHPALRTSFDVSNFSEPLQLVHHTDRVPLDVVDVRDLAADAQEEEIRAWIQRDQAKGFDSSDYPLVRFHVHRRSDDSFQFSGSFHHAIIDGWSDAVMVTEIFEHYLSAISGQAVELTPATSMFRDFVALERAAMQSAKQRRFWDDMLADYALSALPRNQSVPHALPGRRTVTQIEVPVADTVAEGLKRLAITTTVPLKTVLLAAHMRVLSVISGQTDVVTCVVSSGRLENSDGERVLGLFLNSMPFRLKLSGDSWKQLVLSTYGVEQAMLPYRRYPLAELKRARGGRSIAETLFYFTNYHVYQSLQRFDATLLGSTFHEESSFPLITNFRLDPFTSKLLLDLQGDTRYLSRAQLEAIGGYYERALAAMAADPGGRYERVGLLSGAETAQQLATWNAAAPRTERAAPASVGIHALFEAQVARTPAAAAVVWGTERWTYAELDAQASAVARALRARGVGAETVVGVCVDRSGAMVAALLGVWKAGAAYVPLDPAYPDERVAFMLADAGVRVVLASAAYRERLGELRAWQGGDAPALEIVCLDGDMAALAAAPATAPATAVVSGRQLAYVIYTSGSTGTPKGVGIEHHSLVNLLTWARGAYTAEELAGVLAATSISFDLSLFELFVPLSWGGLVVLAEDALQLPVLPAREAVRLVNTVPSVMGELVQQGLPAGVRTVNLAGEPLRSGLVQALYARGVGRVVDLYGPSEATTYATVAERSAAGPETIGRPIAELQLYLLDAAQQLVPAGVAAEVYLGGAGVARGYLGRPALTAERFVPDPFSATPGARLYRTGDLGRYLPDGNVEFLGRADAQVKLRGYRIELGEVEAALAQYPGVQETVVLLGADTAGRPRLVGYVVGAPERPPAADELRRFLSARLPHYMVPGQLVALDALPRTPNGKVDRRALLAMRHDYTLPAANFAAASTALESVLADIWKEVLGVEQVSIHDSFVDLGGYSLLAVQVTARVKKKTGVTLDPGQMMIQTLGQLAAMLEGPAAPSKP